VFGLACVDPGVTFLTVLLQRRAEAKVSGRADLHDRIFGACKLETELARVLIRLGRHDCRTQHGNNCSRCHFPESFKGCVEKEQVDFPLQISQCHDHELRRTSIVILDRRSLLMFRASVVWSGLGSNDCKNDKVGLTIRRLVYRCFDLFQQSR